MNIDPEIRELHAAGYGLTAIGRKVGVSHPTVWKHLRRLGIKPHAPGRPIGWKRLCAAAMMSGGAGLDEVCAHLEIGRSWALKIEGDIGRPSRNSPAGRKSMA